MSFAIWGISASTGLKKRWRSGHVHALAVLVSRLRCLAPMEKVETVVLQKDMQASGLGRIVSRDGQWKVERLGPGGDACHERHAKQTRCGSWHWMNRVFCCLILTLIAQKGKHRACFTDTDICEFGVQRSPQSRDVVIYCYSGLSAFLRGSRDPFPPTVVAPTPYMFSTFNWILQFVSLHARKTKSSG